MFRIQYEFGVGLQIVLVVFAQNGWQHYDEVIVRTVDGYGEWAVNLLELTLEFG